MNNSTYLDQLLENARFRAWVLGEQPDDTAYWLAWMDNDLARQEAVQQARQLLTGLQGKPVDLSDQHINSRIQQALTQAKEQENEAVATRPLYPQWRYGWVAAAVVLLLAGFGLFRYQTREAAAVYTRQVSEAGEETLVEEVVNRSAQPRHIRLPDNSSVVLRPNSRLRFPKHFDAAKREVYLTGEAFFEVTRHPEQPFFVYANELVTKVLGTSFSVRAYEKDPNVVVVVKTGKVSVFAQADQVSQELRNNHELTGMVLAPNQQAVFQRAEVRLMRSIVDNPKPVAQTIESQTFEFESTPIAQVFAALEKAYGVDIVFDEDAMANCSITAKLGDEPLFDKLKWICTITEASYEVTDGQIIVSGKPCL
ncbi:FecR family protein [Nibrella viscosa]|uniref:FecR family protein n=1 Tax=Nibrella viscosa TaxID=1084524 RepID=A0ABP8JQM0_9BACT